MANKKISQLPEYTGNTTGTWLVMNNSGETQTFKVNLNTVLQSGTSGTSGTSGSSGSSGTSGSNGSSGTSGLSGTSGSSGTSGDSIFAQTGSVWNTTRNIGITGSLFVSNSIYFAPDGNGVTSSIKTLIHPADPNGSVLFFEGDYGVFSQNQLKTNNAFQVSNLNDSGVQYGGFTVLSDTTTDPANVYNNITISDTNTGDNLGLIFSSYGPGPTSQSAMLVAPGTSNVIGDNTVILFNSGSNVMNIVRDVNITGSVHPNGKFITNNQYQSLIIAPQSAENQTLYITSSSGLTSGSNLVLMNNPLSTNTASLYFNNANANIFLGGRTSQISGYNREISGSFNILFNTMPSLSTASIGKVLYNGNLMYARTIVQNASVGNFTNNILYSNATVNMPSGAFGINNNILQGTLNSYATGSVFSFASSISSNIIQGSLDINHINSQLNFNNNVYNGVGTIVDNFYTASNGGGATLTSNFINALSLNLKLSGSYSTGRPIAYNIIGGSNNKISVEKSSINTLSNTIVIGGSLIVSGSDIASTNSNGAAFIGRYNDESLSQADKIIFAVGTGTNVARKTGFWIDSGSVSHISGSAEVIGNTNITGSLNLNSIINLAKSDPLPSGITGSIAVSGSNLYFHNGTAWKQVSLL